jgi:3-oxoacyl-[acyl-carrier protein] reductase
MNLRLENKLALVTASTGGIGRAIAQSLAQEGARVVINGLTEKSVNGAIFSIRRVHPEAWLEPLVADSSQPAGAETMIERFPEIDILVNNLGTYEPVGFFEETDESWRRIFEINILSGVRLARHYLAKMLSRKTGRIIFISSESAINPSPEMPHYGATKTMELGISRNLAELTRGTGVTVNAVMPGSTNSPGVAQFVRKIYPDLPPEEAGREFVRKHRPTSLLQRLLDPKEIADFVAFIVSPLASGINGAALRVDGGIVRSVF